MQKPAFPNSILVYLGIALALLLLAPYFGLHIITSKPQVDENNSQTVNDEQTEDEASGQTNERENTPDTFDDIEDLLKK